MTNKLIAIGVVLLLSALVFCGCGPAADEPTPLPATDVAGGGTPVPDAAPEDTPAPEPSPWPSPEATEESEQTPNPSPSPTADAAGESADVPDPASVRDAALAYLAETLGEGTPSPDLPWTEERTTPEGLVGASTFEYRAGDWLITVSFPIVAPEALVYRVAAANPSTGFEWEGEVDTVGRVSESGKPGAGQVAPSGVSDDDLTELVEGNSAFAFDLYQALREEDGNLFYSPYSISLALAMTYAGAQDDTEQQMADTLHFLLSQERLHPAFSSLDLELASRGEGAQGKDSGGFRLNVANAIWGQEGYEFLPQFLDVLDVNYGAGLEVVDFASDPEGSRTTINDWVSDETEGRIPDLIPPGVIDALTRLVLTNAIYFNAAWAEPFEPAFTKDGPFHLLDGGQVTVPMMSQVGSFPYAEGEGYQAVELPYDGHELSMVILLPGAGEFESFEASLDAEQVNAIVQELGNTQVALTMPRFELDSEFSLKETLSAMGMPVAFSDAADFSGMTGNRDLSISEVIHKAFVSVDEEGTEAAAATGVMVGLTSMPLEPIEVTLDHPFVFLIRDIETGAILFVGRVVDPSA